MNKNCLACGILFYKRDVCAMVAWEKTKFCSRKCSYDFKRGKPFKHSGQFKKNTNPWNKGLTKQTDERVAKISGDNHYEYKGQNVSYIGLHNWVNKEFGKPRTCEHCGTTESKTYDWANISGQYKRDLSDWIRLCRKCHHIFDNKSVKMWETRRSSK